MKKQKFCRYLLIPWIESSFGKEASRNCACQYENYWYFHLFFVDCESLIWIYTIKGYSRQTFNINNHLQSAMEWRFVLKTDF